MLTENTDISDDEIQLLSKLRAGDTTSFDEIYNQYWEKLHNYIYSRVRTAEDAFDLTQEIFVSLWERRSKIEIDTSLSGYLFAIARYKIIKYIKGRINVEEYCDDYNLFLSVLQDNSIDNKINFDDLRNTIESILTNLPPRCQDIFRMSRFQNLTIDEIALKFNISTRTVENQLTFALKLIRAGLPIAIIFVPIVS